MKKFLSIILMLSVFISVVPYEALAYHEHILMSNGITVRHPHGGQLQCHDCGETVIVEASYSGDCDDCILSFCQDFDEHFLIYDCYQTKPNWFGCECACGTSTFDGPVSDLDQFLDEEYERLYDFCDYLNTNTIEHKNPSEFEFDNYFSDFERRQHPHEGYYETRFGEEVYLTSAYNPECIYCVEELCNMGKHSHLADCETRDDYIRAYCFCDKTMKIAPYRLEEFLEERRVTTEHICEDLNYDLAEEVYYEEFEKAQEVQSPQVASNAVESTLDMTFSGPTEHIQNSTFIIEGTATSNYTIEKITAAIHDGSGNTVYSSYIEPNSTQIQIENTTLNNNLHFDYLPVGNYTLYVTVEDSSGTFGEGTISFNVISPPPQSTLTINGDSLPLTIVAGNSFGLRGSVISNYNITEVYGYVIDSNGNTVLSSYDTPNSTFMNIKDARLNWDLSFGKLPTGNYTLLITGYDESGAEVTLDNNFSVVSNTSPSTPTSPSTDNCFHNNEWNGIVYYNNFTPGYYEVSVSDAEINESAYDASETIFNPTKGTVLYLTGKCYNKYNNIWFIVDMNGSKGYIYSGDVKAFSGNNGKSKWDQFLYETSNILAAASFVPGADTFTNIASVPVDVLRGDWLGAGLSIAGVIPFAGEAADAAKVANKIDDINDITKSTAHGTARLIERGFSLSDITRIKKTNNIMHQADGAIVYICKNSAGKYDLIVEGERGIITALKNISEKSLERLSKNYGWR